MVSEAWRNLPDAERKIWDEKARVDKERFEAEKSKYTGPWKVPVEKTQRDPNAPKRPISAFLLFSNSNRSAVKRSKPEATNAEVSRTLAALWKGLPKESRQLYVDKEQQLREQYKVAVAKWRAQEGGNTKDNRQPQVVTSSWNTMLRNEGDKADSSAGKTQLSSPAQFHSALDASTPTTAASSTSHTWQLTEWIKQTSANRASGGAVTRQEVVPFFALSGDVAAVAASANLASVLPVVQSQSNTKHTEADQTMNVDDSHDGHESPEVARGARRPLSVIVGSPSRLSFLSEYDQTLLEDIMELDEASGIFESSSSDDDDEGEGGNGSLGRRASLLSQKSSSNSFDGSGLLDDLNEGLFD